MIFLESARPLGLHISAIRQFLQDHPEIQSSKLTTSQTNSAVVKPETLGTNEPYIAKYVDRYDANGIPLTAPATIFVSHAWRYEFASTVADVMEQHAVKVPGAYFWFDLFTNDQNAVTSKDFDWFANTFTNSIRSIGEVLLVLYPWNEPMPVRRAWCLFEIASAITEKEVLLTIYLPQSEVTAMSSVVEDDNDCLINTLSNIQAEDAEATSEDDRNLIFDVIRNSPGGFYLVNKQVKTSLREWYIEQLFLLFSQSPNNHNLQLAVAKIAKDFGFIDENLQTVMTCLDMVRKESTTEKFDLATVLKTTANMYAFKGELDKNKTLEYYNKSLTIRLGLFGENHLDVAASYRSLAAVYSDREDLDRAVEFYDKSLTIKLDLLGENHPDVLSSYKEIAQVYRRKGDIAKYAEYQQKLLDIKSNT